MTKRKIYISGWLQAPPGSKYYSYHWIQLPGFHHNYQMNLSLFLYLYQYHHADNLSYTTWNISIINLGNYIDFISFFSFSLKTGKAIKLLFMLIIGRLPWNNRLLQFCSPTLFPPLSPPVKLSLINIDNAKNSFKRTCQVSKFLILCSSVEDTYLFPRTWHHSALPWLLMRS